MLMGNHALSNVGDPEQAQKQHHRISVFPLVLNTFDPAGYTGRTIVGRIFCLLVANSPCLDFIMRVSAKAIDGAHLQRRQSRQRRG